MLYSGNDDLEQSRRSRSSSTAVASTAPTETASSKGGVRVEEQILNAVDVSGFVDLDALLDILQAAGCEDVTRESAVAAMKCDADAVTVDDAMALYKSLSEPQGDFVRAQGPNEDDGGIVRTQRVSLARYLWLMTCGSSHRHARVHYEWYIAFTPRHQLSLTAAALACAMGACILLAFGLLWADYNKSVTGRHVDMFRGLIESTFDGFQRHMTLNGQDTLFGNAVAFGHYLEEFGRLKEQAALGRVVDVAAPTASALADAHCNATWLAAIASADAALRVVAWTTHTVAAAMLLLEPHLVSSPLLWRVAATNGTHVLNATTGVVTSVVNQSGTSWCLRGRPGSAGWPDTDDRGVDVPAAVARDLPRAGQRLCLFAQRTKAELRDRVAVRTTDDVAALLRPSVHVGFVRRVGPRLEWQRAPALLGGGSATPCLAANPPAACAEVLAAAGQSTPVTVPMGSAALDAVLVLAHSMPISPSLHVVFVEHRTAFLAQWRAGVVGVIDHLNFAFVWSTELVVGWRDTTTGAIVPQANAFRFADECFQRCGRFAASSQNAIAALIRHESGYTQQPDYRPQPIVSGFAYIHAYDATLLDERDVVDVNNFALRALTAILDAYNAQNTGGLTLYAARQDGIPTTDTFDPSAGCPSAADECLEYPGIGVVYRSDCPHCARWTPLPLGTSVVEVLTHHDTVPERRPFHRLPRTVQAAAIASTAPVRGERLVDELGRHVVVSSVYVKNYSTGFSVTLSTRPEVEATQRSYLGIVIGTIITLSFAALLLAISPYVLRRVEDEWHRNRERIRLEQQRFVDNVRDLMPQSLVSQLAQRFPARCYSMQTQLTLLFVEVAHSKERHRTWPPNMLSFFNSYVTMVIDALCLHYALHKVRPIGDRVFVISGFDEAEHTVNHTVRTVEMATVLHRLASPSFAHFPYKLQALTRAYGATANMAMPDMSGDRDLIGTVVMPQFRSGIHVGDAIAAVTPITDVPHFDVFGAAVGTALRVMRRAQPRSLLVTSAARDLVASYDNGSVFEFAPGPTIMARGKWRTPTHVLTSARSPLPHVVLAELGIRTAKRGVDCTKSTSATNSSYAQTNTATSEADGGWSHPSTHS